jgi:hypothetical protein
MSFKGLRGREGDPQHKTDGAALARVSLPGEDK